MAETRPSEDTDVPSIRRDELVRRQGDPRLILVDVLPAPSFEQRHIPGARNLPAAELEDEAQRLLPDRHAEIVVYCGAFT